MKKTKLECNDPCTEYLKPEWVRISDHYIPIQGRDLSPSMKFVYIACTLSTHSLRVILSQELKWFYALVIQIYRIFPPEVSKCQHFKLFRFGGFRNVWFIIQIMYPPCCTSSGPPPSQLRAWHGLCWRVEVISSLSLVLAQRSFDQSIGWVSRQQDQTIIITGKLSPCALAVA